MSGYEINNTYQYIINREELHLTWLRDADQALGGTPADSVPEMPCRGCDG